MQKSPEAGTSLANLMQRRRAVQLEQRVRGRWEEGVDHRGAYHGALSLGFQTDGC